MALDRRILRTYSMLGESGSLFTQLAECAKTDENISVLTADLGNSSGLNKFMRDCPDKFYNIGIAEQNMIGIAAGMAKVGLKVFAVTFTTFITMRACEQVRVNLGYMKLPIKIIGTRAGIINGIFGNSHYAIEDISIMRAIPNLTIVAPADAFEAVKVLDAAINFDAPMYIRLTGKLNTPMIYKDDYNFEIGKAVVLREGSDVAIFSVGTLTANALKAANILESNGISAAVINMHTIKPLDTEILDKYFSTAKLIATVEEHSIIGGLGGAVAEYKAGKKSAPPQIFIGLPDIYGKAAEYEFLLDRYGLTAEKISATIIQNLRG